MPAAPGKIESFKHGIGFGQINHRRDFPVLQGFGGNGILKGGAHGMTGHTFGVSDDDVLESTGKDSFQGLRLGLRTTTARRGVGFMGEIKQLPAQFITLELVLGLHACHETIQLFGKLAGIDLRGMSGRIERMAAQ